MKRGFTLIELLVVISIIGLLSSIVLASLGSARSKAKDSAIKSEVEQMRTLLEENYNDYGSYLNLQPNIGFTVPSDCTTSSFLGSYGPQAVTLCMAIVSNSGQGVTWNPEKLYMGNDFDNSNKYSIIAALPGSNTAFCMGSSGASSDDTTSLNAFIEPGCIHNP